MWQVLSFTGRFDPAFFARIREPPRQAGEQTEKQRLNNKLAAEARAKYRQAMRYARQREKLREGGDPQPAALTRRRKREALQRDIRELQIEHELRVN